MNPFLANAVAWTLIHSLWEGAIVAGLLFAALSGLRSSQWRYVASCMAMLAVLAAFAATFVRMQQGAPAAYALVIAGSPRVVPAGGLPVPATLPNRFHPEAALPWLPPIWMGGVLLLLARSAVSWAAAQRLRRRGACCVPAPWPERLSQLGLRMGVSRPVLLFESCLAEVPVVIGHLRPAILLPLGLLTGLPAPQVEAILLHELAHIGRFDYLSNLMQTLLETLLFYHPAIWWISGVVRSERENCCDDLAVAASGNVPEYAAALAALEENRRAGYGWALAANGGSLVKRIHRLLYPLEPQRLFLSPLVLAGAVAVGAACLSFGWQTRPSAQLAVKPPVIAPPPVTVAQVVPPPAVQPQQRSPAAVPARIEMPWRKWLNEDVAYIITDEERKAFLAVGSSDDLEKFIEQFWLRRDPTPGTPANEMKEEHYRRIAYANDHFSAAGIPGWKTDRGRIYIMFGPAQEVESHPSGGLYSRSLKDGGGSVFTVPFEQWRYRYLEGIGEDVIIDFVDRAGTGEYRMTRDPNEKVR